MIVTEITELNKTRSKIEIDYAFAFVLYKGELHIYGLKEGCEISEDAYNEIMKNVLPKRAKLRAMNLLKQRSYSEYALTEKLRQGGYPEQVIDEALDYVKSFHYIDDRQYAFDYIEYNKENKSSTRIRQDLKRKGIPEEIIQSLWEENSGKRTNFILDKKETFFSGNRGF